jgi:hypothetical protein
VQNVLGIFKYVWLLFQIVIIYENIHSLELYEKIKGSQHVPHERPVAFIYLQNNLGIPGCVPWQPQQFIVPLGFRYFAGTLTSGVTGVVWYFAQIEWPCARPIAINTNTPAHTKTFNILTTDTSFYLPVPLKPTTNRSRQRWLQRIYKS